MDGNEPQPSTSQVKEPKRKKNKLDLSNTVTYSNSPVSTAVFVDATTKFKKCVSFQLLTGIDEIEMDIAVENDDQVLKVFYEWPSHLVKSQD